MFQSDADADDLDFELLYDTTDKSATWSRWASVRMHDRLRKTLNTPLDRARRGRRRPTPPRCGVCHFREGVTNKHLG